MKFNKHKEGKIDFWILKNEWAPLAKFVPKKKKTKKILGTFLRGRTKVPQMVNHPRN